MSQIVALVIVVALFIGPLVWRLWQDRRRERALAVRAYAHAALSRALGGESFVSVNVTAPLLWRPGRVVLSAPADWQALLEPACRGVLAALPADFELVVRPVLPAASPLAEDLALRRAA